MLFLHTAVTLFGSVVLANAHCVVDPDVSDDVQKCNSEFMQQSEVCTLNFAAAIYTNLRNKSRLHCL